MAAVLLERLVPSAHADAIYCANLFIINRRTWMIGGTGKSHAAELASHRDPAADIARDTVAVIRDGDNLLGRQDPGALPIDPVERERLHHSYKLDIVAYCMTQAEGHRAGG